MTTFEVHDVTRAEKPLPAARNMLDFVTAKIQVKPKSWCKPPTDTRLVNNRSTENSFLESVHKAYDNHYPLVLSPDIIWQCVIQGFAIHVNQNAEKLRLKFVTHEGKKTLRVRMDDYIKNSPDNNWEQAFEVFSEEIRKNIGDEIHGLLTPDFSTTGPVERAASQVVLMNTFKEYFSFCLMSRCGIPSITLEGTVEDWKKLREKTLSLSHFDFQWWTDAVQPTLDEFVNASSGVVNREFWQRMYKRISESGGPYTKGWIVTLFPYIQDGRNFRRNSCRYSVKTSDFPAGTVSTPFVWQYLEEEYDMNFYAGFMGVGQDKKTLALGKPIIGWAVVDKEEEEKSRLGPRSYM